MPKIIVLTQIPAAKPMPAFAESALAPLQHLIAAFEARLLTPS
jgi:hypothetical protein